MKWNETRLVKNAAKLDWEGDLNTFAAELFSEIEKSNSWNFVSSLTFRGSWGLNLASNTIKLYTIRRRTLRRCQKYNKKVSKNFCIKSYDPLKLPRYFDPSTMSILVVGSKLVNGKQSIEFMSIIQKSQYFSFQSMYNSWVNVTCKVEEK